MHTNQDDRESRIIYWCGFWQRVCYGNSSPSSCSYELRFANKRRWLLPPGMLLSPENEDRLDDFFKFHLSPKKLVVYNYKIAKNISNSRTWQHLINGIWAERGCTNHVIFTGLCTPSPVQTSWTTLQFTNTDTC